MSLKKRVFNIQLQATSETSLCGTFMRFIVPHLLNTVKTVSGQSIK